jgi:DNA-directed RNA polymerase subunit F
MKRQTSLTCDGSEAVTLAGLAPNHKSPVQPGAHDLKVLATRRAGTVARLQTATVQHFEPSHAMKTLNRTKKPTNGAANPQNRRFTTTTGSNLTEAIKEIRRLHDELAGAARTILAKAIRLGELLTQLKAELGHGNWLSFVESELPFSERTAQHYMGVFEKREPLKSARFADLLLSEAYRLVIDENTPPCDPGVSRSAAKSPEANQGEVVVSPAKKQAKQRASAPPNFTGADLVSRVRSSREFFESFCKIDPARLANEIKNQLADEISLLIETCRVLAAQLDTSATVIEGTPTDPGKKQSDGKETEE